jgi:hypothetical protein
MLEVVRHWHWPLMCCKTSMQVSDNPGSILLQSKEKDKKCDEEVSATENALTGFEVLLQERAASENELKSSVESECDVGSETNISRYSHRDTTLKEDGRFSKITNLQGENDLCKEDSLPPEAASLSSQNKNIQNEIVPINSKEATIGAEILNESKEINSNVGRMEKKPNLPDLNSLPVELETVHPCTGSVSLAMVYSDTVGNTVSTTDKKIWELDDSAAIIENVRTCDSGWLEAEDCDNLLEEFTDHIVACNVIDNSGRTSKQLTSSENQKGQEITEDKSGKTHFLSSWGRGKRHKHRNEMLVSETLVQDDSQKGEESTKTSKNFLQLTEESVAVDTLRSSLTTSSLKPLNPKELLDCHRDKCGIQGQTLQKVDEIGNDVYEDKLPIKHLRSNKIQSRKVSIGAVDNKNTELISDAIDALKSRCLITSSMKPIKRKDLFDRIEDLSGPPEQTIKEPLDCFRDECGLQDQTLQNVEEIGKDVYGDKLTVKHLRSNEVLTPKVSLGAVNSKNGEFINVDFDAVKSNCLTTSSRKSIKRKDPFASFKYPSGLPEQSMKKVHIEMCAPRHKQFDCEVSPLEVLPEAVVISSDDESDHTFLSKECDYGSKDFIRQHSDHVHLQKDGHITVDPVSKFGFVQKESCKRRKEDKMYYTSMCKGHINEPGIKEDRYYCTCRLTCQKNISATQDQCNGHSHSEKYNCSSVGSDSAHTPSHWKVDLKRYCSHSTSKYCVQPRDGHMNEPGLMEDKSHCKCSFKDQKNVLVTQHRAMVILFQKSGTIVLQEVLSMVKVIFKNFAFIRLLNNVNYQAMAILVKI